jgi:hypothetical protein
MPPSIAREPTPDWLNKKNHPAAFPQAGDAGRVTGSKPLMPTLQPSVGTAMAQKMSNVHVAAPAPSASATAAPACGNAAGMEKSGPSASTIGEETDEESEHELTPEEQKNDEHVKNVEAVIAAAKAAGFTFGKTKWVAAETFINNKEIFDDAGVHVTECVFEGRKEISLNQVKSKLAELRAAAEERKRQQAMVPKQDESQFDFDESESEEERKDEKEEEGEFAALSEAQLNARVAEMKTDLAIKMKQHDVGPVKAVLREYKDALKTDKSLTRDEMLTRKQKCIIIKTYFTEDLREKEYDEFQYQMLSELCAAEVMKKRLPDEIDSLEKKIEKAEEARNTLVTKRAITNAANAISRRKKREADAVSIALGTPTSKRLKNRK